MQLISDNQRGQNASLIATAPIVGKEILNSLRISLAPSQFRAFPVIHGNPCSGRSCGLAQRDWRPQSTASCRDQRAAGGLASTTTVPNVIPATIDSESKRLLIRRAVEPELRDGAGCDPLEEPAFSGGTTN